MFMAKRGHLWLRWTDRARHGSAVAGIVVGLPLVIAALDRAVRAALDVGSLLVCIVLLRDSTDADVEGRNTTSCDESARPMVNIGEKWLWRWD